MEIVSSPIILNGEKQISVFVSFPIDNEEVNIRAFIEELVNDEWVKTTECGGCPAVNDNMYYGVMPLIETTISDNATSIRCTVVASGNIDVETSYELK